MSDELRPSRRIVFQGLGALGVAAALAGCGGDDDTGADPPRSTGSGNGGESKSVGTPGDVLAETSEIPVGGGVVLTDRKVVITQPEEGRFEAFSSVCKHQGFDVGRVSDGTITCTVHGSTYDAATGARTGGPAPENTSLDKVAITVEGGRILAA